jgi:glycosyltransferase involved in cell wall biosynthesis
MMASSLLNISFSFTAHRVAILDEKVLLNEKAKRAKFAIAISEYNKSRLLSQAPEAEPRQINTIYCGIDKKVFFPCPSIKHGLPYFLAVGSLLVRKGHAFLIEACRILKGYGIDFQCVIIGEGPERRELEDLIRRYNMEGEVELPGSVPHEDIQEYYNQADFLVHPSISEGIPVVLMEAMSKGLPVIATNITGIPELVNNEKNGILVPIRDTLELAEAMMRLLNDKELRMRLGKNARGKILRDFDIDINTNKIRELFESALTSGNAKHGDVRM